MKTRLGVAGFLLAGVLLVVAPASAGPIGTVVWNGATFEIEYTGSSGPNLYSFELTADFSSYTGEGGHTDYLMGINFKPSEGDLIAVTATSPSAADGWHYAVDTNLSSANIGCAAGSGNNNFFCGATTDWLNYPTEPADPGPVYSWSFTLQILGVTSPDSLVLNAPLRALFTSGETNLRNGKLYTSLMSETTTTTVPEPGSLLLLTTGIALVFAGRRRRR